MVSLAILDKPPRRGSNCDQNHGNNNCQGEDEDNSWFGTVRGRAGVAFDRIFPYVTGGWAFGHHGTHGTVTGFNAAGAPIETEFGTSKFMSGWTIGGGVEWAVADHWTAKFEYLYIDFGTLDNVNITLPGAPFTLINGHLTENIARVGVNYHFH